MSMFDDPCISVSRKSNEQNMESCKAWMQQVAYQLNYIIPVMQTQISDLEKRVSELEGGVQ